MNGPDSGGYDGYMANWNKFEHIEIISVEVNWVTPSKVTVSAKQTSDLKTGGTYSSTWDFTLLWDATKNTWLFDVSD